MAAEGNRPPPPWQIKRVEVQELQNDHRKPPVGFGLVLAN